MIAGAEARLHKSVVSEANLTHTTSPEAFLAWVKNNVQSSAKLKGIVRTARGVVSDGQGNDWEICDLARHELTRMGYEAKVLYLATSGDHMNRSFTVFRQECGPWRYLDCRYPETAAIYGPVPLLRDIVAMAKDQFKALFKKPVFASIGAEPIVAFGSIDDYLAMVHHWERPPRRLNG